MPLSFHEIEQRLADLHATVPHLLRDSPGSEFWIEFMERADAIRDHVSLEHYDWVTERIYEVLASHGISPPSRWILAAAAEADSRPPPFGR